MIRQTHLLRLPHRPRTVPRDPRLGRWLARFFTYRNALSYAARFPQKPASLNRALRLGAIPFARLPSGWVSGRAQATRLIAMRLTVALCTYNRADFLRQTLAGIAAPNFPRDQFEVLVIDNNSCDHTAAVVAEFRRLPPHPAPHSRNPAGPRLCPQPRDRRSPRRHHPLRRRRHPRPTRLARSNARAFRLRERRKVGAVGGEVIPVFPDGLPPWVAEWHAPLAFRANAGPLPSRHSPMGANLAIPRAVFAQVGIFHTALDRAAGNYFSGGDSEMVRRIRAAGFEIWFAPPPP